MKTAVVVLNWNGKAWLEKFLPNLVNHSQVATVFVADNASTDDSVDYVKINFPTVKIIVNASNGGYAKGYNDVLKQIDAEYFVLINSDIEVTAGWLSPIISLMDSDKQIASCQPKILNYNSKTKFEYAGASGGFIDNLGYPFCRGRIFDDLEQDKGQYNDAVEVFWATGACLFVRSTHFWELGGLDEDFFAHQEEIDLCWRLKNKGYKIMVQPKSVVYHVGGGTLNAGSPFKTHLNFRNNLFMLFKNLPISSLFTTIPMRLVLDGVAALTFLNKEKGLEHVLAIAKAHFSFYFAIPNLIAKRQKISQKNSLVGKMNWSILVKNKMNGIKQFSEL
ncbi:MAG: glycosyltransferase family 2 protein [Flavobacteriales bacterium]|nr:glycosyltransferase family 2 protein [Flavobacteriales bacterium]MBT6964927.1 glycosyltransferase family 2 protein [Flavobacteriales bacterium]